MVEHRPSTIARLAVVAVCLLGQAAVASALLWHHHHDGQVGSCSVCVLAASADRVCEPGAMPTLPPSPVARVTEVGFAAPGGRPAPRAVARGPPCSE